MPNVTVIVPARNEEANIEGCLRSLLGAIHPGATCGNSAEVDAGIVVADDSSTDRTAHIAQTIDGVRVLRVPTLPAGWVGKNHALAYATGQAQETNWFLFTDADTLHVPGSLAKVLEQAEGYDLYSLSPEQVTERWWERAVIPRVFAELERLYRFAEVNDPAHPAAAANGQYLLIRREVYERLGGHTALAGEILEDVAMARRAKQAGFRIYFGSGQGIVRTRMYRTFGAMWEGWTKNLYLLYGRDRRRMLRAALRTASPLYAALLLNSIRHYRAGHHVTWKGRDYAVSL